MISPALYPDSTAERNAWVLAQRDTGMTVVPNRPYTFAVEQERDIEGSIVPIAMIFLTNKECPLRCVMCDLWKNTLKSPVGIGQIPEQIDFALSRLPKARQVKLYNRGSFFDPAAIPPDDYSEIARRVCEFDRIIVECHPAFLGERCLRFRDRCAGQLEVAIGLETAHEPTLEKLNKGMGLRQFERAAAFLKRQGIALRVFLLIRPPFLEHSEGTFWTQQSICVALEHGATAISLIPTRAGNGAMEKLQALGAFRPPTLSTIEDSLDQAIQLRRSRVFVDLWDLERFSTCPACFGERRARLEQMNFSQSIIPRIPCRCSGAGGEVHLFSRERKSVATSASPILRQFKASASTLDPE